MSDSAQDFPYPQLPTAVDAIRLLTVEPGDFFDPLVCTIKAVAFSSKPKYVALSYTWQDPYPDNTFFPVTPDDVNASPASVRSQSRTGTAIDTTLQENQGKSSTDGGLVSPRLVNQRSVFIRVNDHPFPLHLNLHLALLHLRSSTHSFTLWIDAICINQSDMKERNKQVSLMSFIYTRAQMVVAWLGAREYRTHRDPFRSMSMDWKSGQTRVLAASVAKENRFYSSFEPDKGTIARIAKSTYWTRLWIVQEVCLPRLLVFVYGSKLWSYEDLQGLEELRSVRSSLPPLGQSAQTVESSAFKAMFRLLDAKEARFSDAMKLESLIERFAKQICTELKDRIYGLLALANDVRPVSEDEEFTDPIEKRSGSPSSLTESFLAKPQKGAGPFIVSYSRTYYEIWTDVIKFLSFRSPNIEGQFSNSVWSTKGEQFGEESSWRHERSICIVRTAGIVQEALGGKIDEELSNMDLPKASDFFFFGASKTSEFNKTKLIYETPTIMAIGYLSGEILQLGPEYASLATSVHAEQDWIDCWENSYHQPTDFEWLRKINEHFIAKILYFEDSDLVRIRPIQNPGVVGWRVTSNRPNTSHPMYGAKYQKMWNEDIDLQNQSKGPRICLGTRRLITLVPSVARTGDVIVRFWNCSAAIVMRPIDSRILQSEKANNSEPNSAFMLVGRADVMEDVDFLQTPETRNQRWQFQDLSPILENGTQAPGALFIDMDLRTLQMITSSASRYNYEH